MLMKLLTDKLLSLCGNINLPPGSPARYNPLDLILLVHVQEKVYIKMTATKE